MSHNVLIADDGKMNRFIIKKILNDNIEDVKIFEAVNGVEALDLIEKEDIDLLILDLIMPKMNGFETLKILDKKNITNDIPVIVSSTITEITSIEQTLGSGAIDYFTKPFSKEEIDIILPLKVKNAIKYYEQKKTIKRLNKEISEELKNANKFQNLMLPKTNEFKHLDLFIKYQPSLGIGGDFFDCVELDDELWFMIADVTGHGIAAGMISSMVKVMFRNCIDDKFVKSPSKVLERMNQNVFDYFYHDSNDNPVVFTGFIGVIKNHELKYSSAGQPFPILYHHEEKEIIPLKQNGVNIGFFEDIKYSEDKISLDTNDILLVYTDGLFSSGKNSDFTNWPLVEDYSRENKEILKDNPKLFLEKIFAYFLNRHEKNDNKYTDDVAIMLLKYK